MFSVAAISLLVCVVKLFIWYVAVCCLCVRVPDVLVCGMFGCELQFTTKPDLWKFRLAFIFRVAKFRVFTYIL